MWKVVACTVGVLAGLAALAGGALVDGGLYDVAATTQHFQPVYSVPATSTRRSVVWRARDIEARTQPLPSALNDPSPEWKPRELDWR